MLGSREMFSRGFSHTVGKRTTKDSFGATIGHMRFGFRLKSDTPKKLYALWKTFSSATYALILIFAKRTLWLRAQDFQRQKLSDG